MRVTHVSGKPRVTVSDDEVLLWVRMRQAGVTSSEIGRQWGCTQEKVRNATNRVKRDDMALCGAEVAGFYW